MGILNRNGRRVRISCRLAYVGAAQDLEGEAQIIDLSFSGCRATCASPPPVGTQLYVSLYLPGMEGPLSIQLAVVRWVRQTLMGLQFCSIPSPHRERLQDWIMRAPYGQSVQIRPTARREASGAPLQTR
jgi:PilZ domain